MLSPENEQRVEQFETSILSSCFVDATAHHPAVDERLLTFRGKRILRAIRGGTDELGFADVRRVLVNLREDSNDEDQLHSDYEYLAMLLDNAVKNTNIEWCARKLLTIRCEESAAASAQAAVQAITKGDGYARVSEHLEAAIESLQPDPDDVIDPTIDIAELLANPVTPKVPWSISGLFAKGDIVMIGGEGGTGKSIVALDVSIALATGTHFLGMEVMGAQRVLYIDEENQGHVIRRRIRQHLVGREIAAAPDGFVYCLQAGLTVHTPEGQQRVRALVDKHRPQWVVLDSLVRFIGGSDENSNTGAAEFNAILKAERVRSDVGFIILHHLAKPSKDRPDPVHRIRGASDYVNATDALLTIEGERDSDRRVLTPQQRRTATVPSMAITWQESDDGQSAVLSTTGSEWASADALVETTLRAAGTDGVLRQDLIGTLRADGYAGADRTVSRAIGSMTRRRLVKTAKEGKQVRVWLLDACPQQQELEAPVPEPPPGGGIEG